MQPWEPPSRSPDPSGARPGGPLPGGPLPEGQDHPDEDESLVRPFVITGGRARHATVHLRVESLVVRTGSPPAGALQFEHAAILEVCQTPVSVAEVAARTSIPLGVAQVLVGDLADAGLVRVHEATPTATPELLMRMIDAVRAL